MTKRKAKPKRKPLGRPLTEVTDQDVEITPEDIERVKMYVEKFGTLRLKGMLAAKVEDEGDFE
jgi:hypothetical protein